METKNLVCKIRTELGKNANGRMRRDGIIPGNMIFQGKSTNLAVPEAEFGKMIKTGLRQSTIFNLEIEGAEATNPVFVKELQRNPVNGEILHVDFYRVTTGVKVLVPVAIEITGTAKGVKVGGALESFVRVLKVKAAPESLKDVIEVDITDLDVGDAIYLKDLNIPADWDVLTEGNPIILKIARSRLSRQSAQEGTPAAEAKAEA